jgi:ubiquinone/menaquinone biosynthesis C-methylase UbiE
MGSRKIIATSFWNTYSYFYDDLINLYPYRNLLSRVLSKTELTKNSNVLDLGCGTGNLCQALLEQAPEAHVEGVDWSASMLKRARNKLKNYSNVNLIQGNIIPYLQSAKSNHYTDVILVNAVYTIANHKLLWDQIYKCLKPGGSLIFANPDRTGNWSILKEQINHSSWTSLVRPRLMGVWLIDGLLSLLGKAGKYDFTPKDKLYSELQEANFSVNKSLTERCYGGDKDGIDLIIVASKPKAML